MIVNCLVQDLQDRQREEGGKQEMRFVIFLSNLLFQTINLTASGERRTFSLCCFFFLFVLTSLKVNYEAFRDGVIFYIVCYIVFVLYVLWCDAMFL